LAFIVRATPADSRTARAALSAAVHRNQFSFPGVTSWVKSIFCRRETMEPLLAVGLDDSRLPRSLTTAENVKATAARNAGFPLVRFATTSKLRSNWPVSSRQMHLVRVPISAQKLVALGHD